MSGRTAAILGLGETGAAWAKALDAAGWTIRVFDPSDLIEGSIPKGASARRMQTISATVRDAQWIIIALPQRLELIQKVIQRAQAESPEDAVVVTTARDMDLDAMQGCARRPERVVMLRAGDAGQVDLSMTNRNDDTIRAGILSLLSEIEGDLHLPGAMVADDEAGDNAALA